VRRFVLFSAAAAALAVGAASAPAYYHYVHFADAPDGKVRRVEKFDLAALTDRRIFFYVSREQLPVLAVNDSFDGVLSQVRQALSVWDAVPTSELRVGFGGVVDGVLPGNSPAGQIVFAELPPGVIGMGGPVVTGDAAGGFIPIVRSQVVLSDNLVDGSRPRTSFSELFFSTLVHEIGHALGLQHTLASSAMSTDVTRATTRSQPLGADDFAGLSVLYPTTAFRQRTGIIEGRVTFRNGASASLASVTAIHPSGLVVTALTDPDGRYRMEGLLPGDYLLYVQPLPPSSQAGLGPANIVLPVDALGVTIGAGGSFRGTFLGGADRPGDSPRAAVRAGRTVGGVDFQVEARPAASLYNITTYSFPGNNAPGVHPAFLDLTSRDGFLVATGQGLTAALAGLEIEAIGRDVPIRAAGLYDPDPRFARIDFGQAPFVSVGPLHLLFRTRDDLYLLPGAVHVADRPAPVIHWITPDFSLTEDAWRVGGERFDPAAEVYFDGAPGQVLAFDSETEEIVVAPPPGPPSRRAVVTVYNPDGQSSALTLPDGNAVFEYASGPQPTFEMAPAEAAPDTDILVDVRILNAQLEPSQLVLGVGSSDVVVRDIDAVSSDRFRAVITVRKGAEPGRYPVTLSNGLQTLIRLDAFEIIPEASGFETKPLVRYHALVNSATGLPDLSPGVLASLFGVNLTGGNPASVKVRIGGVEARLLAVTATQINLQIPEQMREGAAELVIANSAGESNPILVRLDRASPGLFAAIDAAGGGSATLARGRSISLLATGLGPSVMAARIAETQPPVQIVFGGMRLRPSRIEPYSSAPGIWRVNFDIPDIKLPGSIRVALLVEGRTSNELTLSTSAAVAGEGAE
jgi:uncharacterized protein (TIGR03437 family)